MGQDEELYGKQYEYDEEAPSFRKNVKKSTGKTKETFASMAETEKTDDASHHFSDEDEEITDEEALRAKIIAERIRDFLSNFAYVIYTSTALFILIDLILIATKYHMMALLLGVL